MSSGGTRVYVGGLVEGIKKEDLEREFDKYGKLNSVWVALNPPGFAFIEFENMQEAEDACSAMNGFEMLEAAGVVISEDAPLEAPRVVGLSGAGDLLTVTAKVLGIISNIESSITSRQMNEQSSVYL
ncbi:RNA-binding protein Rsf1-like [Nymphalis io]|uniref:RNA-binding protein Rsf1-like n=1 Tax=Inachis io TaxID=171585 RepID=UPI00216A52B9|nr:RNA-binding protein Rsf1-like [Nymphalis io]